MATPVPSNLRELTGIAGALVLLDPGSMRRCVLLGLWVASCLPESGLELRDKGVTGAEATGFTAVGAIRSERNGVTCTATLVAPRVIVTVKSCLLEGTEPPDIAFYLGPRLDQSREPDARGIGAFRFGALPSRIDQVPDEYANLVAIALDRDPGVAPMPYRTRSMTNAERGRSVEVVGYGESAPGRRDGGVRRYATSTIWSVHTRDPIFVTTRRADDGTHCGTSDYGGPAILDGEVAGVFGWPADPRQPCAVGGRYFRIDEAAGLITNAEELVAQVAPLELPDTPGDGAAWTCRPSNGTDSALDRSDDACDCGCGVVDRACTDGCADRGCRAAGCDYCADADGALVECAASEPETDPEPEPQPRPDPNGGGLEGDASCVDVLRDQWDVSFQAEDPVDTVQNGVPCSMAQPVRIRSPFHGRDGDVAFTGGEIEVECEFALVLAAFADELAAEGVTSFEHWGAYSCRNTGGGNPSQHALGTAIDIASIVKNGERHRVARDWSDADGVLPTLATTMQEQFETVLTPDDNADHSDHIHAGDWM